MSVKKEKYNVPQLEIILLHNPIDILVSCSLDGSAADFEEGEDL